MKRILVFKRYMKANFNRLKIFPLLGFPSWKSSDPKIMGIKLTFSKISAGKKAPEDSR